MIHLSPRNAFLIFARTVIPVLFFLFQGCANIVPPEGGKKDETDPVLLSSKPADSALNIKITKIELRFNKFMELKDLQSNLQMSPLLPVNPTVISYGKRIEIKMADSLLEANTTYRLTLGNALVDNREANPYKNFVYIFSTGSYFDSLKLHGRVWDAATGLPDSTATIVLYPESENDSAILRKKPSYAQKADADGYFRFELLPNNAFHAYAIQDADNNNVYTPITEKIDFLDSPAYPLYEDDSLLHFFIFKEESDSSLANTEEAPGHSDMRSRTRPKNYSKQDLGYEVQVDTFSQEKGSFELTKPLIIELHKAFSEIDSSRIYLSYDEDGIEVESIVKFNIDSAIIQLKTEWQPNKLYTLRLVKDWAKDSSGASLPPGKYLFRTKRNEDYGTLKVHIDSAFVGNKFVLYIQRESDSIYQAPITSVDVRLPLLQPGNYTLQIIVDENENGYWDTGDFFKKKHAESVIPYPGKVVLKSGWENEIDFKQADDKVGEQGTMDDRIPKNPEFRKSKNE